ncbi:MAG: ferredoxin--nitrite reductase, partial [Phycisphaeraceae bacterium]
RLTGEQNVLIPDIPRSWLAELRREPLLDELPLEAHPAIAGTQSCTGSEYCSMAAIETKTRAADIARALARRVPGAGRLRIHWSACHAGCGQHAIADIGLVGRRVQRGGESVEAVDIYLGNSAADRLAERVREQVPCDELLGELVGIVEQRFAMASAG